MKISHLRAVGLAGLLLWTGPAASQPVDRGERVILEVVTTLEPGQFVWAPELSPAGPLLLVVNLATQRTVLFRSGVPIAASTVSTGRDGYETPTGVFTILQKHKEHYSNIYDNAPMPNMQRLTWGGVALHAGKLPGYPASHGCIRLPLEFSDLLFDVTSLGMTVVITNVPEPARPANPVHGAPLELESGSIDSMPFDWHPERANHGVVSAVISAADQRAIVFRDGIEIGRSPVRIDAEGLVPMAYVLRSRDGDQREWITLDLAGSGTSGSTGAASRIEAPATFRNSVLGMLTPGSVVVVTPEPLSGGSGGAALTVIENERP